MSPWNRSSGTTAGLPVTPIRARDFDLTEKVIRDWDQVTMVTSADIGLGVSLHTPIIQPNYAHFELRIRPLGTAITDMRARPIAGWTGSGR